MLHSANKAGSELESTAGVTATTGALHLGSDAALAVCREMSSRQVLPYFPRMLIGQQWICLTWLFLLAVFEP